MQANKRFEKMFLDTSNIPCNLLILLITIEVSK